jgi:hypothetical protein
MKRELGYPAVRTVRPLPEKRLRAPEVVEKQGVGVLDIGAMECWKTQYSITPALRLGVPAEPGAASSVSVD